MFGGGGSFKIATFRGIAIRLDYSWVIFAILIGAGQYQARSEILSDNDALTSTILFLALFVFGVFCHEVAHAVVARTFSIPVRSITITFWGGYTQLDEQTERPSQQFMISAAGPLTSLTFGLVLMGLAERISGGAIAGTFHQVGVLSIVIAGLNSLPGLPLDGGQMLRSIVWGATKKPAEATRIAGYAGQVIAVAVMAYGGYQFTRQDSGGGIWLLFLGFMLFQAARQATTSAATGAALGRGTVADAMGPPPTPIPADISLSDALDLQLRDHPEATFPVVDSSAHPVGVISFARASVVGQHDPMQTVRSAVIPMDAIATLDVDVALDQAVRTLGKSGAALVLREGALVGMISTQTIAAWVKEPPRRTESDDAGDPRVGPQG